MLPKKDSDDFNTCLNLQDVLYNEILFEWRRNYGSRRSPDYRPLCTPFSRWIRGKLRTNFDVHYVFPKNNSDGSSEVAFYVTKYMLKPSDREQRLQQALHLNLDFDEYERIWSIVRPRNFASLGLGLNGSLTPFGIEPDMKIVDYVKDCVSLSKCSESSPKFFTPSSGKSFPLSRFYRSKFYCYTEDDEAFFNKVQDNPDNVVLDDKDFSQKLITESKFKSIVELSDLHDQSEDLEDMFI